MISHVVFISIGSNLGNRAANCRFGIAALGDSGAVAVTGVSAFYDTAPVDYTQQDRFVNVAVRGETGLEPIQLLEKLKKIETTAGRKEGGVRFGPRVLDLDIIFFDDRVMDTGSLVIPHPRMHERRFVLQPICDIDAEVVHPVFKRRVRELLQALPTDDRQDVVGL